MECCSFFHSCHQIDTNKCITVPEAFSAESQNLKSKMQGISFHFFFFLFLFVVLSSFLSSFAFVFAISFFQILSLFLPPWCCLYHPCVLSPLPKHWYCCLVFPSIIRLILLLLISASLLGLLTCFSQSWEESVRRSDSPETTSMMLEHCPGTWSGKWLNNRMSHETQTTWEV